MDKHNIGDAGGTHPYRAAGECIPQSKMKNPARLTPIVGRKFPQKGIKLSSDHPNVFMLTANADKRVPWMAQREVHLSLENVWRQADAWLVGYYLIMPDHLHLFCAPNDLKFSIEKWSQYWKSQFSRQNRNPDWVWQLGQHHHRMRSQDHYREKLAYVRENPLRKSLVEKPEDWKFTGTIHPLPW